jgi:hypothetical protein
MRSLRNFAWFLYARVLIAEGSYVRATAMVNLAFWMAEAAGVDQEHHIHKNTPDIMICS